MSKSTKMHLLGLVITATFCHIAVNDFHYLRQGGYVCSFTCLFICLFVSRIAQRLLNRFSQTSAERWYTGRL